MLRAWDVVVRSPSRDGCSRAPVAKVAKPNIAEPVAGPNR